MEYIILAVLPGIENRFVYPTGCLFGSVLPRFLAFFASYYAQCITKQLIKV